MSTDSSWQQVVTGIIPALNFLYGVYKDLRAARKAEVEAAKKAKETASQALIGKTTSWPAHLNWDKVATLFWLGNDLMWIEDMMYRGALPERVLQGITHAQQYVKRLGFPDDKSPANNLKVCNTIISSLVGLKGSTDVEETLLRQHYSTVAQEIQTVKWIISGIASSANEPDFEKLRAL